MTQQQFKMFPTAHQNKWRYIVYRL